MGTKKPLSVGYSPARKAGMKRSTYKGRRRLRYPAKTPRFWRSLERFHTIGLRLAGFLHQFKTPLHVIQSQAELLLEDEGLSPQVHQSLQLIHQNAARLAAQAQVMMEAARGSQNGTQIAPVEKLMEEICQAAQTDCRKRNISIEKEMMATSPIRMEPVALEGALHNLVNNAIEAMPAGGVLKIKTYEASDLNHVGVEIQDTGMGMSRQELTRIHQPLQSSKKQGTGLGVYITRHILRRHHAHVRWASKPGAGTKVTVLFPAVKS
jgi:signal transduction histidine kinase